MLALGKQDNAECKITKLNAAIIIMLDTINVSSVWTYKFFHITDNFVKNIYWIILSTKFLKILFWPDLYQFLSLYDSSRVFMVFIKSLDDSLSWISTFFPICLPSCFMSLFTLFMHIVRFASWSFPSWSRPLSFLCSLFGFNSLGFHEFFNPHRTTVCWLN